MHWLLKVISLGHVRTFTHHRLLLLEQKFNLHVMLNAGELPQGLARMGRGCGVASSGVTVAAAAAPRPPPAHPVPRVPRLARCAAPLPQTRSFWRRRAPRTATSTTFARWTRTCTTGEGWGGVCVCGVVWACVCVCVGGCVGVWWVCGCVGVGVGVVWCGVGVWCGVCVWCVRGECVDGSVCVCVCVCVRERERDREKERERERECFLGQSEGGLPHHHTCHHCRRPQRRPCSLPACLPACLPAPLPAARACTKSTCCASSRASCGRSLMRW